MNPLHRLGRRARRLSGRSKAVGLFFATSLAARGLGVACQLFQVPVAMRALGPEAFGLWMTLTSVGYVLTFADFGLGQGAQNKLAEAFATGDTERARELWGSSLAFLGTVGLLVATVVALVAPWLDYTALFNLSEPAVRAGARAAVTVTLLLFCANLPLGLAQRLAYGRQEGWMHNLAQAAGAIGALGGVILATQCHWTLAAIIAAAVVPVLAANAALLAAQLQRLGWLHPAAWRCRWATMRELMGLGAYFGVQQVQLTLLLALPQGIISTHLGAAAVTPYNLAQRLFNLFAIVQNAFMLPLWPAYSDAHAKGDFRWIRRTLVFSLGATLLGVIAPMALGAAFARPVLGYWVGGSGSLPTPALVWLLFLWNALVFLEQPFGYMLAGISEVRRLTFYAVVSTVASAVLMFLFVRPHGAEGVVAGMALGFLPYLLLGNIAEAVRVLRIFPPHRHPVSPLIDAPPATESQL